MSIVLSMVDYLRPDGEPLFQSLDLVLGDGEKAALVGHSGVGKSTLIRLMAGELTPAAGAVTVGGTRWTVPQHTGQYDEMPVIRALGVEPQWLALRAILGGDAAEIHFETLQDDWELEDRVAEALAGWGLGDVDPERPMGSLSGGEKTKVFLAGAQIHRPDLLLLDEPSNHLDQQSRQKLYEFIKTWTGALLVVSHDRTLLDLMDTTLELTTLGLEAFGGNYTFYRGQKDGQLQALQHQRDEQEKALKQARQKAKELAEQRQKKEVRGKAHGQKQSLPRIVAGNLQRQAEVSSARMKEVHENKMSGLSDELRQTRSRIEELLPLRLSLGTPHLHKGKLLAEGREVQVVYGDRVLWTLSFQIRSGDRIRIAGPNGSGKTSLLRLLTGDRQPDAGVLWRAEVPFAWLDQDYSLLDPALRVLQQVERFNSRLLPEHSLKSLLHQHQFPAEKWHTPTGDLSGGEKLKLALCCLAAGTEAPELLLLDEPTNNLDIRSQELLTTAIREYSGTVLVVSHDVAFLREIGIEQEMTLA
ncbi:MAG: ABC-F family ATP-binding cassette domain-containing protein [Siphonobacter aquaeclarae]|nr:ABC-F family ATP-binding cassette domain-containing protein [Siphonobacter aquaeclarae]